MKRLLRAAPLLLSITILGCGQSGNSDNSQAQQVESDAIKSPVATSGDSMSGSGETNIVWPALHNPIQQDESIEQRITDIISNMTLEDKIGQMIQPEIRSITPAQVKKYRIGSVLNGGGTKPYDKEDATAEDWIRLADAYYDASMDTSDGGVAIPIIWGTDAVHGHNNVVGATIFPHNIGLGAANDPALIKRIAEATAREVAATGVDWTFAPTLAVVQDDRWGRTYESYSENPDIVARYAKEIVEGLQGVANTEEFLDPKRSIATAKHFLGDGGTDDGIDQGNNLSDETVMRDIHAAGYFTALEAGVQTVMASYNSWHGEKLHGHHYMLTTVLKNALGFDGFIVGDWNGHGQIPGCDNTQCAAAVNAGIDMFMVPSDWEALYHNTLAQVKNGEIAMSRIDDAVRRIIRVKIRAGLFERGKPSNRPYSGKDNLIGSEAHRDIAREAVRKSLVLLKNNGNILPLNRNSRIAVVGDAADDMGKQTGGWTISWQGTGNTKESFPNGSSILDGIKSVVAAAGGEVIVSEDGSGLRQEDVDVAIAVFGENPYAEMHGDITTYEYQPGNKIDLKLLKSLVEKNIPVVSIFLSGRPLWINPELNHSQAFVAAWLPGSEGKAVADVLFKNAAGEINYDFTGKLSFTWPKTPTQKLNYVGEAAASNYDPLFPFGYGLRYSDTQTVANNLSEAGMAPSPESSSSMNLLSAQPTVPWQLFLQEKDDNSIKVRDQRVSGLFNTVVVTQDQTDNTIRKIEWTGEREAKVYLATNSPMDFTSYTEDGVLKFDLRLDAPVRKELHIGMTCGDDCGGQLPLSKLSNTLAVGNWVTYQIPLQCFAAEDVELDSVFTGFSVVSDAAAAVSIKEISIEKEGKQSASLQCE